jgi:hypothetical protein
MRTLVTAALLLASDGGFGAGRPERLVAADWLRQGIDLVRVRIGGQECPF